MKDVVELKRYPILYVDDERANLLVFRHNFEDEFTIITAESGGEALDILSKNEVCVLVADQRMPEMTGVALAEKVRQDYPEVVRMILTAYSDINAATESINRGHVFRYVTKPWRRDDLASTLRNCIEVYTLNETVRDLQLRMMRSERLALLGFVAAGIAHDLKSPLTCLRANLESIMFDLRGRVGEPLSEEDIQETDQIIRECLDETTHIAAFIDTIRTQISDQPARRDLVDLGEVVDSTMKLVKGEILRRARLEVERSETPLVRGDPAQLGQVVLNLLVNAAQAIERGRAWENDIRVRVTTDGDRVHLAVQDSGRGIAPEDHQRIFEPFFSKKANSGTGLGLAIVRQIVEQHEGEIALESEVGRGTTFTISLAAAPPGATVLPFRE